MAERTELITRGGGCAHSRGGTAVSEKKTDADAAGAIVARAEHNGADLCGIAGRRRLETARRRSESPRFNQEVS